MFFRSIQRGFASLHRFSGRDSQGQFWPYAMVVFFAVMGVGMIMMAWVMSDFFVAADRYALTNPEAVTVMQGPGFYHKEIALDGPGAPWPDISRMVGSLGAIVVVFVVLMAAAITRRLHDIGFRGWWALTPLAFITICLSLFPVMVRTIMADAATDPAMDPSVEFATMGLFLVLIVNNLLYLASLMALVIFLALPGKHQLNRFGPPVSFRPSSAAPPPASM